MTYFKNLVKYNIEQKANKFNNNSDKSMQIKNIFFVLLAVNSYQLQASKVSDAMLRQWFKAAHEGDIEVIANLIDKVDVNVKNQFDYIFATQDATTLMIAAEMGHETLMKFLLAVPGINTDGALAFAAQKGHENIVKILLEVPSINVNAEIHTGYTALTTAARNGKENILRLLVGVPGININSKNHYGLTALMWAASDKNESLVKLLLQAPGIDINAQDNNKKNALMWAAYYGQAHIVKILLDIPTINIVARDINYQTAAEIAKDRNHTELAQQLALIINLKQKEIANRPFVAIKTHDLKLLKSIIDSEECIDLIADDKRNTLLDAAFAANCPIIVEYLLNKAKYPQILLSRFPFEQVNPSSDLFKFCMDLAYAD